MILSEIKERLKHNLIKIYNVDLERNNPEINLGFRKIISYMLEEITVMRISFDNKKDYDEYSIYGYKDYTIAYGSEYEQNILSNLCNVRSYIDDDEKLIIKYRILLYYKNSYQLTFNDINYLDIQDKDFKRFYRKMKIKKLLNNVF